MPAGPASRARWAATWAAVAAAAALLAALVQCSTRPPTPLGADAPRDRFSEARARVVTHHLSEEIGLRVAGTPAADRAARDLVATLRALPGVEVELQDVRGEYVYGDMTFAYRVRNVIARLPGRRPEAILLGAHYDSPPESVGAADDALGVGVIVEVLRALAAEGPREHTVIALLNGGEEAGLLAADGFLAHPWAASVRGFINLEAAGLTGMPILFQAGPGDRWLADAYADVPRPFGTIVGQDLFQAGLIDSDTDGRVFRGAGWSGLDLALFESGYLYHTALDRLDRVEPGSAQGMGDNVLALTRALASRALPAHDPAAASPIYFDLLSRWMFVYAPGTALVLALIAAALVALGSGLAIRRGLLGAARLGIAVGLALGGLVVGLVAALAAGLTTASVLDEPHGWFDQPSLALLGFGAAALLGALGPQALWAWRRGRAGRSRDEDALAAFAGGAVAWVALALLLALAEIGSGYVAIVASLGAGAALVAAVWTPVRLRWAPLLAGWAIGALVTIQFGVSVTRLFVPLVGRMASPSPDDPFIAVVVALPVLACALAVAPAVHLAGRPGLTAALLGALTVVGVALSALAFPYSEAEPKRILIDHVDTGGDRAEVRVIGFDALAGGELGLPGNASAPASGRPPPSITVTPAPSPSSSPSSPDPAGERRVRVHIGPGAYEKIVVELPRARIAGWSLETPPSATAGERLRLTIVGAEDEGHDLELIVRGAAPVSMSVREEYLGGTPATRAIEAALPAWCTAYARVTTRAVITL